MVEFLSPEWIDALDRAARGSTSLAEGLVDEPFVMEQHVTLLDGAEVVYHLELTPTGGGAAAGPAARADVVITTDVDTASRLAQGVINAQVALSAGRLRVGGDIGVFARRAESLLALGDVFAAVRSDTTFPGLDGAPITSAR